VERAGGTSFFEKRGWRAELAAISRDPDGRFETAEEQRLAVLAELVRSRERIEAEIPGKRVRHLAYPWNLHGERVERLLAETGYDSAYAGMTRHRGPGSAVPPCYALARVFGDFLPMLPGAGRSGLATTLWYKAVRRMTKGLPYRTEADDAHRSPP
jgi:hypothetical protein